MGMKCDYQLDNNPFVKLFNRTKYLFLPYIKVLTSYILKDSKEICNKIW